MPSDEATERHMIERFDAWEESDVHWDAVGALLGWTRPMEGIASKAIVCEEAHVDAVGGEDNPFCSLQHAAAIEGTVDP